MKGLPFRIAESKQGFAPVEYEAGWETLSPRDARGIVWLFEEPKHTATYIMGVDTAQGITNWDRTIPQDDDTDNSAIEVFRIGKREVKKLDKETNKESTVTISTAYQVAEYAAPVDYEQTAAVCNALGRLYKGTGRMGVAHSIIEVYPGPGWMVEKTLIGKYGYLNFYQPKFINSLEPKTAKGIGWVANRESVKNLWVEGCRYLENRQVVLKSPWLLNEMETTKPLNFLAHVSEAQDGFTDDRLRAAMLVWWAAWDFSSQVKVETQTTIERNSKPVNWQSSDLSATSLKDEWEKRYSELGE